MRASEREGLIAMSEEKTIQEKLLKVISELKVPKGQYNDFSNFNYRSAEDILEAVKPVCYENGLLLRITDEVIMIGERYYIKATVSVQDDSGTTIKSVGLAREPESKKGMDGSQITGTASSYARKYAMNGLFLIDDTKDADTNEYKNQQENRKQQNGKNNQRNKNNQNNQSGQQKPLINGKQLETLKDEARKISELAGNNPDDVLGKLNQMLNIQEASQMLNENFGGAMKVLRKWHKNYEEKAGQTHE